MLANGHTLRRTRWNSGAFDAAVNVLPDLLERYRMLPSIYLRFSFDPVTSVGKWYTSSGSSYQSEFLGADDSRPPPHVRFATIRYETPVPHYALLQRL